MGWLLSLIPSLLTAGIQAYNKTKDVSIAALTATASIASAQVQAMSLWIGHPLSPPSIMCYGVAIWFFKALAVDKVVCPALGYACSTDPISGETAVIASLVVSGMFFAGITNIIKR